MPLGSRQPACPASCNGARKWLHACGNPESAVCSPAHALSPWLGHKPVCGMTPDETLALFCCPGTNPVVYAALNSHANYPAASPAWVYAEVPPPPVSVAKPVSHFVFVYSSPYPIQKLCEDTGQACLHIHHSAHGNRTATGGRVMSLHFDPHLCFGAGAAGLPAQPGRRLHRGPHVDGAGAGRPFPANAQEYW